MKVQITVIGDTSPDEARLMKALRNTISHCVVTKLETFERVGTIEKMDAVVLSLAEAADEKPCQS